MLCGLCKRVGRLDELLGGTSSTAAQQAPTKVHIYFYLHYAGRGTLACKCPGALCQSRGHKPSFGELELVGP